MAILISILAGVFLAQALPPFVSDVVMMILWSTVFYWAVAKILEAHTKKEVVLWTTTLVFSALNAFAHLADAIVFIQNLK